MMKKLTGLILFALLLSFWSSCSSSGSQKNATKVEAKSVKKATLEASVNKEPLLILTQAQFIYKEMNGRRHPVPGPARMVLCSNKNGVWQKQIVEDKESNVFHKAMPAQAIGYPNRILTIGANEAHLKLWRRESKGWVADDLWAPVFGGKHNRLRDVEIGDVTGDHQPDIVIATHDQGVVAVLTGKGTEWKATELTRKKRTFVHEIELGDLDQDGLSEIYATPSAPNKMDGSVQPGMIVRFTYKDGAFTQSVVEKFLQRHVKEILVAKLGNKGLFLFAAIEAEVSKGAQGEVIVDPAKIKLYRFANGKFEGSVIAQLKDRQCRFLNAGDVNGDGSVDIVASGYKSGLWLLEQPSGKSLTETWRKTLIDGNSSGYEHATALFDADDDGIDEIYVAADDQKSLNRYTWKDGHFKKEKLLGIEESKITFGLMAGKMR